MARAENKAEAGGTAHVVAALAKALREQEQLSQEQLGKKVGYTASAISAMETCAQPASDQMLVKLEEAIGGGLGVFQKARKWMLLEKYPARFRGFSELEAGAVTLSSYETLVVDGLFQTEEYARALIGGGYPPVSEQKREELVEARLARRALFNRDPAPLIELILEESVLRRPFGSWEILRGQLRSLAEDAGRDNVCVQVLPLERGLRGTHAGDRGAMKLVETVDHQHVVYMEIEDQGVGRRRTMTGTLQRQRRRQLRRSRLPGPGPPVAPERRPHPRLQGPGVSIPRRELRGLGGIPQLAPLTTTSPQRDTTTPSVTFLRVGVPSPPAQGRLPS